MRGTITSRIIRSPAAKTSSTMWRSSSPSVWWEPTSSRSSSSVICSRWAWGSPPSSRTTTSVERLSSQITGCDSRETRSIIGPSASEKLSARCSARRLGTSSPRTRER